MPVCWRPREISNKDCNRLTMNNLGLPSIRSPILGQCNPRYNERMQSPRAKAPHAYGFLPPIHCKSVPGIISSYPCL